MSERALDRWVTGGLVLYSLVVASALLLAGVPVVRVDGGLARAADLRSALNTGSVNLTYDDGFYYLKIAEHIARGAGSTFDGVNPTNGYHPLWLLCLVPIFWLTSAPDVALLLALVLQGVLTSIGVGLTYRIARLDFGRYGAVLAALLWVHSQLPYRIALSCLEYSLHAAGILSAIYVYRRWFVDNVPPLRAYLALGILLAMTFLARLDSILLFGCVALAVGSRELRGGFAPAGMRRLLVLSLPVAVAVLLYFGTNLRMFGHSMPVSGVIKRDWSERVLEQDPKYQAHGWLAAKLSSLFWPFDHMKHAYVLFLVSGTVGVALVWLLAMVPGTATKQRLWRARLPKTIAWFAQAPAFWGSLALFSVLQLSFFLLVYHDGYSFQRWYYVIQPWLGAMLMAAVMERTWQCVLPSWHQSTWARRLPSSLAIIVIVGVALASARTVRQWHKEALLGFSRIPLSAAGLWVGANVPSNAVVGAWNAGMISYLSGRQVINLDGLVNSWDFYQTKQYDLCDYWRRVGVSYLVDTFEVDHEVEFINKFYAPGVDLSSCAARLDRVWVGPAYFGTSEHAEAFKVR
jgi:hypothetical protein